ncbi:hypothetical protein Gotur_015628, partial [Gossypium turneri]
MDPTKKQKLDENGIISAVSEPDPITKLTPQDGRKLIKRFIVDQLHDILQEVVCCHLDILLLYTLLPIKIHLKGSYSSVAWVGILQPNSTHI